MGMGLGMVKDTARHRDKGRRDLIMVVFYLSGLVRRIRVGLGMMRLGRFGTGRERRMGIIRRRSDAIAFLGRWSIAHLWLLNSRVSHLVYRCTSMQATPIRAFELREILKSSIVRRATREALVV
jgi:hypothetical protein